MPLILPAPRHWTTDHPAYRHLYRMAFIGVSETEIAEVLNGMGLTTPQGKPFTRENTRRALSSLGLDKRAIELIRTEQFIRHIQPQLEQQ